MILNELIKNADSKYKDFQKKLIPTIDADTILGVRAPICKKIAKKYTGTKTGDDFLNSLPHAYYDENIVHAYMLANLRGEIKNIKEKINDFLKYIDNWAVCDSLCAHLKYFFSNKEKMLDYVLSMLKSEDEYIVRFSLVCLLNYYISDEYIDLLLDTVLVVKSDKYYINMALAWLISFMLIKQYEKTLPLIKGGALDKWVHNKAIQKVCESYRISKIQKEELRSLKK